MTIVNDSTIKTLDQITAADELDTGGKAFNCSRLRRAGFAVPSGLVILARATDDDVAGAAGHQWFDGHPAESRFAVRSSGIGEDGAGHSFAGVHETVLNVGRQDVAEAIRRCRQSVHSAQAATYRENRQIDEGALRTGVLIQPMVAAIVSGVVFTVNPVTGADELVINAAPGLGEALVSGTVDPDEFRVGKTDLAIISSRRGGSDQAAGQRPTLDHAAIDELAQLSMRIERLFAAPQDIEWCRDGHQFWILQSRPVTTARTTGNGEVEWTRANLAEVFPDQMSPQVLAAYEDMLNRSEVRFMGRLLAPALGPMVKNFHGRLYFNLSQLRNVCRVSGAPAASVLRSLGHSDAIEPADEIGTRPPLGVVLPLIPDFIRLVRNDRRAPKLMRQQEQAVDALVRRFAAAHLEDMPDAAIFRELKEWLRTAPDYVQLVLVLGSVVMDEDKLRSACRRVGFAYDDLVYPQLAAGERSVSTQQAFDLVMLADVARREPIAARYFSQSGGQNGGHSASNGAGNFGDFRDALAGTAFLPAFDRFIDQYGHRGHYESDWGLPRYREDPSSILFAIRSHLTKDHPDDLAAISQRLEREAAEAWRRFEARATGWQKWTLLPRVKATLHRLKRRYVMREKCRSDLTRVVAEIRRWHLELAERFVTRGWLVRRDDYFLLHVDEVGKAVRDPANGPGLKAVAHTRSAQLAAERDLRMPLLMRESGLAAALRPADAAGATELTRLNGLCVSPGRVDGEVVVILDPRHFQQMKRGAILVAPATDPSWTPLFTLASGVIVEVGGMLSHASTIAREYGLPALANVKGATRRLRTGDRVRLDATGGFVAPYGSETTAAGAELTGML